MPQITPNADAGRALRGALGEDTIEIDGDELRVLATKLQEHADGLRPLISASNQIGETAVAEAQQFTTDHQPAPVYATTVDSLGRVSDKFSGEIEKVIKQLEADAAALVWIADANDSREEEAVQNTESIDTDLGSGGSSSGSPYIQTVSSQSGPNFNWDGNDDFDFDYEIDTGGAGGGESNPRVPI